MPTPPTSNYGTTRDRAASISFADIETAARQLMLAGAYPSVGAIRRALKRGSTTTIAEAMRRFWKDQAALNAGNPVALTRLPPEFADAAVALWEQALRLSQQTTLVDDNAARARLEELSREATLRIRSMELREKEWDMAARVRERALAETRDQMNLLMKELTADRIELRSRDARIADLESQIEQYRHHLATLVTGAIGRNRALASKQRPNRTPSTKPKSRASRAPGAQRGISARARVMPRGKRHLGTRRK
jgi:Plasmid replication region DNA-binding N-term